MDYISKYSSPVGELTLASDGSAIVGLWFKDQKFFAECLDFKYENNDDISVIKDTCIWLDEYFSGEIPDFLPKLKLRTTDFRQRVADIMLTIPFGATMTYGEIAENFAKERGIRRFSAQAVGNAVAHNNISILIPCHRVVGANNSLVGYSAGTNIKQFLLNHENNSILIHNYQSRVK